MDRSFPSVRRAALGLTLLALGVSGGCIHQLLATGIYLWQGGNIVPAECEALQEQRVVVLCRPPASQEYRHAGAAREIGERVARLLEMHVDDIEVVSQQEVDNWVDEEDWENFKDLGRSVKATRVVYIELDDFELYKGKTVYQGNADLTVSVYDMEQRKFVWDKRVGQVLFPRNSGIPAADKPVQAFQRQFIDVVSIQIAEYFYEHDPNTMFALDAVANQ
ncbi:MAG: hypothetical protein CMJ58_04890 [Planctomycetaceae bacterium]|nr:hypothetical protein [Planctomycetaceae bacterium]